METRACTPGRRITSATTSWPSTRKCRRPTSSSSRSEDTHMAALSFSVTTVVLQLDYFSGTWLNNNRPDRKHVDGCSSHCTGSASPPSWKAGLTECWRRVLRSPWKTCTITVFSRSVSPTLMKDVTLIITERGRWWPSEVWVSLQDKKAMLSFTTGATQTMFQPDGVNGDINIMLWPLQVTSYLREDNSETSGSLTCSTLVPFRMELCTSVDLRFSLRRYSGVRLTPHPQYAPRCSMDGGRGWRDWWQKSLWCSPAPNYLTSALRVAFWCGQKWRSSKSQSLSGSPRVTIWGNRYHLITSSKLHAGITVMQRQIVGNKSCLFRSS